jgi:hypothetical protein
MKVDKEILEKVEKNGITRHCFYSRLRRGWSIEEAMNTGTLDKSTASRMAAKKSHWSKWEPGRFSRADYNRRKNEKEWKI